MEIPDLQIALLVLGAVLGLNAGLQWWVLWRIDRRTREMYQRTREMYQLLISTTRVWVAVLALAELEIEIAWDDSGHEIDIRYAGVEAEGKEERDGGSG